MKVYLRPDEPALSRALTRVADALQAHAPAGVTLVPTRAEADLVVHHVIGAGQLAEIAKDVTAGRQYAMIQYCVRSSDLKDPAAWLPSWNDAKVVWSYYDLWQMIGDTISEPDGPARLGRHGFYSESVFRRVYYHAPLGVDRTVFRLTNPSGPRPWLLATTGFVAETECLRECAEAVARVGGRMLHVGHELSLGPHVDRVLSVSDATLAKLFNQCRFVAGLRRDEGFELPVIEGYACGAIPITFDRDHYNHWFGTFNVRMKEGSPAYVTRELEDILGRSGYRSTPAQADLDRDLAPFDWRRVCEGFWERVMA